MVKSSRLTRTTKPKERAQVEHYTGAVFCRHSRENRIAQKTRSARRVNTSQETRVKR